MAELEEYNNTNFYLKEKHLKFLNTIDDNNRSRALRTVIDWEMKKQKQQKLYQLLDRLLLPFGIGALILIVGLQTPMSGYTVFSFIIASVFIGIGTTIGINYAIRTYRRKRNRI